MHETSPVSFVIAAIWESGRKFAVRVYRTRAAIEVLVLLSRIADTER